MRDAARGEDRLAGAELDATIADLETHFAFHDVEPFFLRKVQMESRTRVGHEIGVLDDEEVACCVGRDDLEGERAETERVRMAGAVGTGGDGVKGRIGQCWSRQGFGRALREDILESGGGDDRSGGFEEGAAVDGHGGMISEGVGSSQ